MIAILITWIANSLAIYAVAYLLSGVEIADVRHAFIAGAVLSIINAIVKPILVILTLPLTILTLGLFYFIVSAFCLWLTSQLVDGFMLQGAFRTIIASILVSIISTVIHSVLSTAA